MSRPHDRAAGQTRTRRPSTSKFIQKYSGDGIGTEKNIHGYRSQRGSGVTFAGIWMRWMLRSTLSRTAENGALIGTRRSPRCSRNTGDLLSRQLRVLWPIFSRCGRTRKTRGSRPVGTCTGSGVQLCPATCCVLPAETNGLGQPILPESSMLRGSFHILFEVSSYGRHLDLCAQSVSTGAKEVRW